MKLIFLLILLLPLIFSLPKRNCQTIYADEFSESNSNTDCLHLTFRQDVTHPEIFSFPSSQTFTNLEISGKTSSSFSIQVLGSASTVTVDNLYAPLGKILLSSVSGDFSVSWSQIGEVNVSSSSALMSTFDSSFSNFYFVSSSNTLQFIRSRFSHIMMSWKNFDPNPLTFRAVSSEIKSFDFSSAPLNVVEFDYTNTKIETGVLTWVNDMKDIEILKLSNTSLDWGLFNHISDRNKLTHFDISNNSISMDVFPDVSKSNIKYLDASNNQIKYFLNIKNRYLNKTNFEYNLTPNNFNCVPHWMDQGQQYCYENKPYSRYSYGLTFEQALDIVGNDYNEIDYIFNNNYALSNLDCLRARSLAEDDEYSFQKVEAACSARKQCQPNAGYTISKKTDPSSRVAPTLLWRSINETDSQVFTLSIPPLAQIDLDILIVIDNAKANQVSNLISGIDNLLTGLDSVYRDVRLALAYVSSDQIYSNPFTQSASDMKDQINLIKSKFVSSNGTTPALWVINALLQDTNRVWRSDAYKVVALMPLYPLSDSTNSETFTSTLVEKNVNVVFLPTNNPKTSYDSLVVNYGDIQQVDDDWANWSSKLINSIDNLMSVRLRLVPSNDTLKIVTLIDSPPFDVPTRTLTTRVNFRNPSASFPQINSANFTLSYLGWGKCKVIYQWNRSPLQPNDYLSQSRDSSGLTTPIRGIDPDGDLVNFVPVNPSNSDWDTVRLGLRNGTFVFYHINHTKPFFYNDKDLLDLQFQRPSNNFLGKISLSYQLFDGCSYSSPTTALEFEYLPPANLSGTVETTPSPCFIGGDCEAKITLEGMIARVPGSYSLKVLSSTVNVTAAPSLSVNQEMTYTQPYSQNQLTIKYSIPTTFVGTFADYTFSLSNTALEYETNTFRLTLETELNTPPFLLYPSVENPISLFEGPPFFTMWVNASDFNAYQSYRLNITVGGNMSVLTQIQNPSSNSSFFEIRFDYPNGFLGEMKYQFSFYDGITKSQDYNLRAVIISRNITKILNQEVITKEESKVALELMTNTTIIKNTTQVLGNVATLAIGMIKGGLNATNVTTDKLSIAVQVIQANTSVGIGAGDTAKSSAVIPSGAINSVNSTGAFALMTVFSYNPYDDIKDANETIISNVTSLSLLNEAGKEITVSGLEGDNQISITIEIDEDLYVKDSELSCIWWDVANETWTSSGCSLKLDSKSAVCTCSHLTSFTVSQKAKPPQTDPSSAVNNKSTNLIAIIVPVVLGTVFIVVILIVIFVVLRKKKADQMSSSNLELENMDLVPKGSIQIHEKIGQGAYGNVFRATYQSTTTVALKQVTKKSNNLAFMREVDNLKRLHHPHVIQFLGVYKDNESHYCMILEYMKNGSLLEQLRERTLDPDQLLRIACDVSAGVAYLHEMKVIHCDLAARNILLSGENRAKISDFGMSFRSGETGPTTTPAVRWASPEVLKNGAYSLQSDVWSFGVVLWEIYNQGKIPYQIQDNEKVQSQIEKGVRLEFPSDTPKEVRTLAQSCWDEKSKRPSMKYIFECLSEILKPGYIKEIGASEGDKEVYVYQSDK